MPPDTLKTCWSLSPLIVRRLAPGPSISTALVISRMSRVSVMVWAPTLNSAGVECDHVAGAGLVDFKTE